MKLKLLARALSIPTICLSTLSFQAFPKDHPALDTFIVKGLMSDGDWVRVPREDYKITDDQLVSVKTHGRFVKVMIEYRREY